MRFVLAGLVVLGAWALVACGGVTEPVPSPPPAKIGEAPPGPADVASTQRPVSLPSTDLTAEPPAPKMKTDLDDAQARQTCELRAKMDPGKFTAVGFNLKSAVTLTASQDPERNVGTAAAPEYYDALWLTFGDAPVRSHDDQHGLTSTVAWSSYVLTTRSPTPRPAAFTEVGVETRVRMALGTSGESWCAADGTGGGRGAGAPDDVEATLVITTRTSDLVEGRIRIDGLTGSYAGMNGMQLDFHAPIHAAASATESVCCLR